MRKKPFKEPHTHRFAGTSAQHATRSLLLSLLLGMTAIARAELPSATIDDIRQARGSGLPAVVDLGARHCIPCKRMAPILASLSDTYRGKASVLFVDADADLKTALEMGLRMMPTQVFFDATGREVKRHIGFMDETALVQELKALGVE